ncbi:hypothetical protein D3C86_937340 [compost metagenome]
MMKNLLPGKSIRLLQIITDQARAVCVTGFHLQNLLVTKLCTLPSWGQKVVGLKYRFEVSVWMKLPKKVMQHTINIKMVQVKKADLMFG